MSCNPRRRKRCFHEDRHEDYGKKENVPNFCPAFGNFFDFSPAQTLSTGSSITFAEVGQTCNVSNQSPTTITVCENGVYFVKFEILVSTTVALAVPSPVTFAIYLCDNLVRGSQTGISLPAGTPAGTAFEVVGESLLCIPCRGNIRVVLTSALPAGVVVGVPTVGGVPVFTAPGGPPTTAEITLFKVSC